MQCQNSEPYTKDFPGIIFLDFYCFQREVGLEFLVLFYLKGTFYSMLCFEKNEIFTKITVYFTHTKKNDREQLISLWRASTKK